MNVIARLFLCSAAFATTTACQVFSAPGSSVSSASQGVDTYFSQQLDAGRVQLAAGRTTLAIESFRVAARDPQLAAKALNGLAISYDRLQRPDLARRYFTQSLAAAPHDEQITRNMARFEVRQATLALQQAERQTTLAAAHEFLDKHPLDQMGAEALAAVGTVQPAPARRLPREVQLVSSASGVSLQRRTDAVATQPARVMVAQRAPASDYPVRVEFSRQAARPAPPAYPVRIALNSPGR